MARPNDIADTLDALERKLRALESELGGGPAPPAPAGAAPAPPGSGGLDDLARQIDDLSRFREHLHRVGRELEQEYERVLARLEMDPAPAAAPEPEPGPEPAPEPTAPAAPAPQPVALTVDAGPFADLGALAAFEQAVAGVGGVDAVEVTGFEGRRAQLAVRTTAPAQPLAEEMRAALPLPVARIAVDAGRLIVDLDGDG